MQQVNDYDTVFALHEACLQISRRAINETKPVMMDSQNSSSLSILNQILQTHYRLNAEPPTKPLIVRNDLFDLSTATDAYGPRSVVGLSLLEWWGGEYEVRSKI